MAILYKSSKHARKFEEDSLTEQEHKDSCDINLMLKAASRGQDIRTRKTSDYGHDDLTMDALSMRIQKADLEEKLLSGQKEFTQKELDLFPEEIRKKFGYKLKKEPPKPEPQNDELNDEMGDAKAPKKQAKPKKQNQDPDPES